MQDTAALATHRLRVKIQGAVQGVGFRPFVYRLTAELALPGWVINDGQGVFIEVEGPSPSCVNSSNVCPQRRPRAR